MKSVLTAATLGLLTIAACADQGTEYGSTAAKLSYDQWKATIYQEPTTGFWVLDWDTKITKEADLRALYDSMQEGALAVYNMGGQDIIWSATQKMNLTYCISNTFAGN